MIDIFGKFTKEDAERLEVRSANYFEFLKQSTVLLFVKCDGPNASKITFSVGSHYLGYESKQLEGVDFFDLIPGKHRGLHTKANFLMNIFE
jgi:hypothetical protein